jgi:hypothetical protein
MLSVNRIVGTGVIINPFGWLIHCTGEGITLWAVMRHAVVAGLLAMLLAPTTRVAAQTAQPLPNASQRDAVATILRTARNDEGGTLAEQHAGRLRALGFDVVPVLGELLTDNRVGTEAARALIVVDEGRAIGLIFEAVPWATLSTQLVAFSWFLDHAPALAHRVDGEAHAAALRVLNPIESTAMAQLALHTIGLTGTDADFPLLQRFAGQQSAAMVNLRSASESALARLGSLPHLELIRSEVEAPLPSGASYLQGVRTAVKLRKAAMTGNASLAPAICRHIADPEVGVFDLTINPGRVAASTLSQLLEPAPPATPAAPRRTHEQWKDYCRQQVQ